MKRGLQEGAYLFSNALLFCAMAPVIRTSRVHWLEPTASLEREAGVRPVIFCTFHRHAHALYCVFGDHVAPSLRPSVIGHDGALSEAQTRAGAWAGYPVMKFQRHGPVSPRNQLIDRLRGYRGTIVVLPDSGGPYGVVKAGIVEIARETSALLVPFSIRVQPALVLGSTLRHVIPLPGSRMDVLRSEPIEGATATREALQASLTEVEARASTLPDRRVEG